MRSTLRRPKKFLIADGFDSFQPTVGPKRSITVKAKSLYGMPLQLKPARLHELDDRGLAPPAPQLPQ
jgi:hypothetical protein